MITAYVGLPGSGKTYLMSADVINETRRRTREAWCNYPLVNAHYYDDFRLIQGVTKGIICADELNALAHAHNWRALDPKLLTLWTQSRKLGIEFWYTSQGFHMVNNQVRQLTNYVWKCRHVIGPWHTARLFDACDVERDRIRIKPIRTRWFRINPKITCKYNTLFRIKPLGLDEADFEPEDLPTFSEDLELPKMPEIRWRPRETSLSAE